MGDADQRCRSCGTPLAADNAEGRCGQCRVAERQQEPAAPVVPAEFWEDRTMQAALRARHMGKVIRAYRQHRHHGYRGISQTKMATWTHTSQGQISRIENGPELLHLSRLFFWARFLGIPQRYLWFQLPEHRGGDEISAPSPAPPSDDAGVDAPGTADDALAPRPRAAELPPDAGGSE